MPLITNADILLDKKSINTEIEYSSEEETDMYLIEETHTQVNFSLKKYPFTGERKTVKSGLVDVDNRKIENEVEQDLDQKSSIQIHSDIKSEDEDFINSQYFISHEEIDLKPEDDVEESDTQASVIEKKGLGQNIKRVATHKTVELNNNNRAYEKAGKPHFKNDMIETPVEKRLKNHKVRHKPKGPRIHKCPDCPYQSKRNGDFNRHLVRHKNPDETVWLRCTECPYKTNRKETLKQHSIQHKKPDEIEWHRCTECPYKAKQKGGLKQHAIIHNETRQNEIFKCAHCVFETPWKISLKKHLLVHAPWMYCPELECSYKTHIKSHLKRHSLVHSNDKFFKCAQCPYQAKRQQSLKWHQLKHESKLTRVTRDKLHACPQCPYKTIYKNNLKAHVRMHANADQLAWYNVMK